MTINCTAIPQNLLVAEFFGYEEGAFTDAQIRNKGLLELMTEGGMVFSDEIGLMPLDLQTKILSVLETGTFRRVGGVENIQAEIRFVAATNENLQEAEAEGRFGQGLFYRLNVAPISLPPLREREKDALLLARHFLAIYSRRSNAPCCSAPLT